MAYRDEMWFWYISCYDILYDKTITVPLVFEIELSPLIRICFKYYELYLLQVSDLKTII